MGVVFGTTVLAGLLGRLFYGRIKKRNDKKANTNEPESQSETKKTKAEEKKD